jgi:hypothetical protein
VSGSSGELGNPKTKITTDQYFVPSLLFKAEKILTIGSVVNSDENDVLVCSEPSPIIDLVGVGAESQRAAL